jgi:hypothetical protein
MDIDVKKIPKKAAERRKFLRNHMWPEVAEEQLWLRKKKIGFTTIPRTMSLIGRIQDNASEKGFPLSSTYLTLWCWVFDEAFLEIRNPKEFAFESGFTGPRAEVTWKNRMQRLQDLGFIKARTGLAGPFHYVLLLDPIQVIKNLYKDRQHDLYYDVLISRLTQIGAHDDVIDTVVVSSDDADLVS